MNRWADKRVRDTTSLERGVERPRSSQCYITSLTDSPQPIGYPNGSDYGQQREGHKPPLAPAANDEDKEEAEQPQGSGVEHPQVEELPAAEPAREKPERVACQ